MNMEIERANEEFRKYRFRFISQLFNSLVIGDSYDVTIDNHVKVSFSFTFYFT